jgi:hypothetical protein
LFIESAKTFKKLLLNAKITKPLLKILEIRTALLLADGSPDKILNYFMEKYKNKATLSLTKKFLNLQSSILQMRRFIGIF